MDQREMIIYKSYDLFKRYGIRSVTMDEIAVQCGMSKKTVYQSFSDKDALVTSIMENNIQMSIDGCFRSQNQSENAIHEVFLSLDWLHEMFDGVNPALLFDLRKYHSPIFQKLEEHKTKFLFQIFKANLEKGIEEGYYRREIKVDILVPLRIHTMTLVFETDLFPTNKYTLYEIDYEITMHELYGIATIKGVEMIENYKNQRQTN